MKKKSVIYIAILMIVLAGFVLFAGPLITVKTINRWTCAYTGSQKGYTTWFGILKSNEWQQVSPIEAWLAQHNRQIEHHWVRTAATHYSLFGGVDRRHGRAPAMLYFDHILQTVFIETASEDEILTILEVVKNKPEDEAEKAVDEVVNRMIEKM